MGQTLCFTKADDFGEPFRVCSVLSISLASFSGLESDSLKFKINNYVLCGTVHFLKKII